MYTRWLMAIILQSTLVICSLATSTHAYAQGRIALVVGNGSYSNVSVLPNPPNDAADVSQSLQRLGFNVTSLTDVKFDDFRRALIEFGRAARGAEMAVLYFAGHGVEIMGDNWLLPVDAELRNDIDVDTEAVSLRSAMLAVSNAKTLGLVILDACRNNPFAGKMRRAGPSPALDPGLASVEPGENVLVAYAARDGTTASDGAGRNSPYTTALLRNIETPGLEIEFLFRNVRDDVMSATNDEQQPFVYGSLSSTEIYLKDGPQGQLAYNSSDVMSDAGDIAWSFLKETSDVGTLRRFVEQFPASDRLADAKRRVAALESSASASPGGASPGQSYEASIELDQLVRQTARPILRNIPAVELAWKVVKGTKDAAVIRRFAEQFPGGQRLAEAKQRLTDIGELPSIPRDVLIRAASDPDVLQCYRINDVTTPECQRALDRFPAIWQFVSDFRFRFELCKLLGQLGHCDDTVRDLWSRQLFDQNYSHLRQERSLEFGHRGTFHSFHTGERSKNVSFHHGREHSNNHAASNLRAHKEKSSKNERAERHRNNESKYKPSEVKTSVTKTVDKGGNNKPPDHPSGPSMHSSGHH